ncbi:hypothetical protein GCM10027275_24880 [Rhabdobacter roseus]|uniref:Uncharacterized protein n=1 Tax=Rhabdobacter roseus TaxID=1655419 RepID=A0A840TW76_9BACT|nr:DUF6712 family protein [Rhabdobacter roseus]MBB5284428.1 hypothetical protein [Rhabdobacter roseus]
MKILFCSTEELREFVPVGVNVTFENLKPSLLEAAESILIPYLSEELYDRILTKYQAANTEMSEPEQVLFQRMRLVVARFGLAMYVPEGEVKVTDSGISTIGKSENLTAAYDHQVLRLVESLIQKGFDALERLLTWLEAAPQLTAFPEFANSEQYTRSLRGLVRKAGQLSDIYPIGGSRMTFNSLLPELLNVEDDRLKPLIGRDKYATIKAAANLADEYDDLRRVACKAVVFQAVANVIRLQQAIQLDAGGLRVYGTTISGTNNTKFYKVPSEKDRLAAAAEAQARADFYWDEVSTLLAEINNPGGGRFEPDFLSIGGLTMF